MWRAHQAHCLLHTSVREGWGLNVIEANAMGTPAVVYPVPGLTESTLHGATGRVSKRETPRALAEEILHFAQHQEDYQRCRVLAWKRARNFIGTASCPRHAIGWSRWHSGMAIVMKRSLIIFGFLPLTDLSILSDK